MSGNNRILVKITRRDNWQFAPTPWESFDNRLANFWGGAIEGTPERYACEVVASFGWEHLLDEFMALPTTREGEFVFERIANS